ncbi:MAG: hypothetical protein ACK4WK_07480, partial [Anaerolineae bacterium]
FTITPGAGGAWDGNRYTAEKDGIWTVTGTWGTLGDTAVLTVLARSTAKLGLVFLEMRRAAEDLERML